jgi:hypothetical protein
VFVAGPGKHLFQRLGPEVMVYPRDWTGDLAPDLVVFPCGQIREFDTLKSDLPEQVRSRVASGEARVVFDGSSEGLAHSAGLSELLHGYLGRVGAPVERAVYVTQHRGFADDYRTYCAGAGVARPMTVLNYDYWIKRLIAPYAIKGVGFFNRRKPLFRQRARTRPRRFLSLNWSPRPIKLIFLARLLRDGLWDQGYVSFGGPAQLRQLKLFNAHRVVLSAARLEGFEDLAPELSPFLTRLAEMDEIQLKRDVVESPLKIYDHLTNDIALPEYPQSWFSAVTETEMLDRPARVTEKVFKPLLNFHPFVVFGNPGSLAFLRGLGFETFPEMIDESYDGVADPRLRFDMAYAQMERLCRMDEAALGQLEAKLAGKLEHNARLALTELPHRYREEFDRDLIDALAPVPPPAGAGLAGLGRAAFTNWLPMLGRRRIP